MQQQTDAPPQNAAESASDVAFIDAQTGKLWVSSVCPETLQFFVEYGGSRYINRRMRDMLDASLTRLGKYHCAVSEGLALKVGAEILHNYHRDSEDTPVSGATTPVARVGTGTGDGRVGVGAGTGDGRVGVGAGEHVSNPFRCAECGIECANQSGLTRHVNAKHSGA